MIHQRPAPRRLPTWLVVSFIAAGCMAALFISVLLAPYVRHRQPEPTHFKLEPPDPLPTRTALKAEIDRRQLRIWLRDHPDQDDDDGGGGDDHGLFVEIAAQGDDCDALRDILRRMQGPPDCIIVSCRHEVRPHVYDGDWSRVAYGGRWNPGTGYYPLCATK